MKQITLFDFKMGLDGKGYVLGLMLHYGGYVCLSWVTLELLIDIGAARVVELLRRDFNRKLAAR